MIVGIVQGREALIRLTIRGFRGRHQEIEAVVSWFSLIWKNRSIELAT